MICQHEDTLEALEDIESGRVVAGEEVISWLASWGDEDELEPPQ
ncbi:MAG: CopG family transcriptional regulator [Candidatus Electrothrix sp. ATG1]|nr:CopG family transcriptional regulator [Candidatus Electrothrix sp. ATG1]